MVFGLLGRCVLAVCQKFVDATIGKAVGALVAGMTGMAFYPLPLDFVLFGQSVQDLPQIGIFDGFLVSSAPAIAFPVVNPLADAFLHVLRIGKNVCGARLLERFKGANDGGKFHAVVGGVRFTAPKFFFDCARLQECAPAARAGVATAAAVSVDGDCFIDHGVQFPFE